MIKCNFSGKLQELIERAEIGNNEDVDYILSHLTIDSTLAMTRFVFQEHQIISEPQLEIC